MRINEIRRTHRTSLAYSLSIIALSDYLVREKAYVSSRQVLISGNSIGANITASKQAESRKDSIHKLSIANKEAFETEYWILLSKYSAKISKRQAESLIADLQ